MLSTASHFCLFCVKLFQTTPSRLVYLRYVLVSHFRLRTDLPRGPFPSGFPTRIFVDYCCPPTKCAICPCLPQPPPIDHQNNIWWGVQIIKHLIMQYSPGSCHFLPLRHKYRTRYLISEHTQTTLFPQWGQTKSHTHTDQAKLEFCIF